MKSTIERAILTVECICIFYSLFPSVGVWLLSSSLKFPVHMELSTKQKPEMRSFWKSVFIYIRGGNKTKSVPFGISQRADANWRETLRKLY